MSPNLNTLFPGKVVGGLFKDSGLNQDVDDETRLFLAADRPWWFNSMFPTSIPYLFHTGVLLPQDFVLYITYQYSMFPAFLFS